MIVFLDTSALVKLYLAEAHSDLVHTAVEQAETVAVCRIAWAESCASLARRARETPEDEAALLAARAALAQDWPRFFIVELTQPVVARACEFADAFALRGYDGAQLAAAHQILAAAPGETVFGCFDRRLNQAARVLGFDLL